VKRAAIAMAVQFAQFWDQQTAGRLCTPCCSLLGISEAKVGLDAVRTQNDRADGPRVRRVS
jgi:hypothetical protein